MTKLFDAKWKLFLSGAIFGLLAMLLAIMGNPGNMAICIACFVRDMAGAMKLHSAEAVQYFRPEIVGFILGSFLISIATKEYKATAGSSPLIRFLLGMMMMIGALVFLGCPLRMLIRMSAGDLNAYVGLIGFAGGIRDLALLKDASLISVLGGLFVVMLVYNIATGNFHLSFTGQPIAHAQHLWNILGLYVVGFSAVLAGGCPFRQLILTGQGSCDSAVTFLGMLIGAAVAHNFGLAGGADSVADGVYKVGGIGAAGQAAVLLGFAVLLAITLTHLPRKEGSV